MRRERRGNVQNREGSVSDHKGTPEIEKVEGNGSRARELLQGGLNNLGDTISLCFASVEDMLEGRISTGEATVINTAVGRALKAVELQLKYSNRNGKERALPFPE